MSASVLRAIAGRSTDQDKSTAVSMTGTGTSSSGPVNQVFGRSVPPVAVLAVVVARSWALGYPCRVLCRLPFFET